ncbi:helix-turn-helix domain-containing protein [Pontibacter sp. H249]|uniref:helix-turn-helix domain-containing protein n=1 Tax=Pontibacter sp. H249 TaxID=3133420 RepID=UPI0030BE6320
MSRLGQKISEIRKRKGLSQEELAAKASINLRTLQRVEKGETEPRGYTLKSICQALQVDVEEVYDYNKEADRSVLLLLHLSVLSYFMVPLGNIIFPLIIWITQKRKVLHVQEQGIKLLNFQITWSLITYPLIVVYGIMKILHYPGANYAITAYLVLYFLNVVYVVRAVLLIYKESDKNLYPLALNIIKP